MSLDNNPISVGSELLKLFWERSLNHKEKLVSKTTNMPSKPGKNSIQGHQAGRQREIREGSCEGILGNTSVVEAKCECEFGREKSQRGQLQSRQLR